MNRWYAIAFAMCTLTTACKKKDKNTLAKAEEPLPSITAMITLRSNVLDTTRYYYDDQGRCTRYVGPGMTTDIVYEGNTATETARGGGARRFYKTIFYMRGDMVDSALYFWIDQGDNEHPLSLKTYTYNNERKPTKFEIYDFASRKLQLVYNYSWSNGNLVEVSPVVYAAAGEPKAATYRYDESRSNTLKVRRPIATDQVLHMSDKLLQHAELTNVPSGTKVTEDYTYEYDDKGRVTRQVVKGKDREYRYLYE